MTVVQIIELVVAAALIGLAIWTMRRPADAEGHGSQGAVILLIVGAIVAVHGLGLMNYRPSPGELEARS
jgi:hypothetical protein